MAPAFDSPSTLMFGRGKDLRQVDGNRGQIFVWQLSPTVYASHVQGHLDRRMAHAIIDLADPLYGSGAVSGFHDWFAMTGYDSHSRIDLTNWVMRHRSQSRLFIGTGSRLVAMGVSVANLALGDLIASFSRPPELEAALSEMMRG